MEELQAKIDAKKQEIKARYKDVINEISNRRNVDVGVAYDMLIATGRGGTDADGIEFDRVAFQKDYEEIKCLSKAMAIMQGLIVD